MPTDIAGLTPPRLAESTERTPGLLVRFRLIIVSHPLDSRRVLKDVVANLRTCFFSVVSHPLDSRRVLKVGRAYSLAHTYALSHTPSTRGEY